MKSATFFLTAFIALSLYSAGVKAQTLQVKQIHDSLYAVSAPANEAKSLRWSDKPDSRKDAKPLKLHGTDPIILASAHPIVRMNVAGKKWYEAPRLISLKGAINFRDMGGYLTKDNREVRWGKIYRSADISKLTDDDLMKVAALNIKIVCDLRGPGEVSAAPDRVPAGVADINLPAGSENIGAPGSFMKYIKNPASADSMMRSVYVRNDFYKAKYKPMFDALLDLEDDKAIMFHCTAGKDRTGIGAALILYALGVDMPMIIKDYEATNEYRKALNDQTVQSMAKMGISESAARSMMAADPTYLQACFASLEKNYGSVDNFLMKDMELTPAKIALLKKKFLY